jgi:small subunit ribosomal protein S15
MTKTQKLETISKFRKHAKDCGTSSVQIALLTERIRQISDHLKGGNKKDYASQLGLLKLVGQRRRLLNYVKKTNLPEYTKLLKQLDIRK